jgi:ribosomal protein L44E
MSRTVEIELLKNGEAIDREIEARENMTYELPTDDDLYSKSIQISFRNYVRQKSKYDIGAVRKIENTPKRTNEKPNRVLTIKLRCVGYHGNSLFCWRAGKVLS